jgi:hypothetical protein
MKALRTAAEAYVARTCGYAGLAIFASAALFVADVALFLRVTGALTTVLAIFLIIKARQALDCDIRKTAIWGMLAPMDRAMAERARQAVAAALRGAYLRAARLAAGAAAGLWALGIVASYAAQPA